MLKNLDINNKFFSFYLSTNKNSLDQSFSSEDFEPQVNIEKNDVSEENIVIINNIYKEKDFYLLNDISNDNIIKSDCLSEPHINDSIDSTIYL